MTPQTDQPAARERFGDLWSAGGFTPVAARYVLVGAATAVLYIALGLFLSGPVGLNIQVAIVIAYATAVAMHFLLHRFFVWSHHGEFALPARQQLVRYGLMTAAQYGFVSGVTAIGPQVLPLSETQAYVLAALIAPVGAFVVMRFLVFHGAEGSDPVRRAVFLDRDGVLNEPVIDPQDGVPESPLRAADVRLCAGAAEGVIALRNGGFELVVVTNQPAAAKGKTTVAELHAANARVRELLAEQGAEIATWKICLHHPDAVIPELGGPCDCRKPAPGMLLEAAAELDLTLEESWMIGDGDADIGAGRAAGCHTVLVQHPLTAHRRSAAAQAFRQAADLHAAAALVLGSDSV